MLDELQKSKYVYIFRSNNDLILSKDGKVEKGKWEYLGNNSLLIEKINESYLFRHGFFDSNILALKVDGKNEYAFMVNESEFEGELNSIQNVLDFLDKKYLNLVGSNLSINEHNYPKKTIPSVFPDASQLDQNFFISIDNDGKYGYVDHSGKVIIEHIYDGVHDFHEGLALVYKEGGYTDNYCFINEEGQQISDISFEYAEDFSEGLALVSHQNLFGFINKNGEVVVPIKYRDASSFEGSRAEVVLGSDKFVIDKTGTRI